MIQTERLTLFPLSLRQLETGLSSIKSLAADLNILIVEDLFAGTAENAVRMKIEKMHMVPGSLHPWFTYWLIRIDCENIGAGFLGFKGNPDEKGEVEIGYGINSIYQNRGYMSEAVRAMIQWAFTHSECEVINATNVKQDNYSSHKVLVKTGFKEVRENEEGITYQLCKD
jgi:RimJ/RimL family protein N-acetyltransferase